VDRLCEELFFSNRARERDDNLIFVRERMLRSEADLRALLDLYLNVRNGKRVADEETNPLVGIMRLSGIVRSEQGRLLERNHIYSQVFDRQWVKANLPEADLRRQRAAFLRGVFRTAGIAAIVVAAMTITGLIAMKEVKKARRAMEKSFFTQAQFRRVSGLSGQRYESLDTLRHARNYYTNLAALRDEVIACLALVDLKEETDGIRSLQQSNVIELNLDLGVSASAQADGAITLRNLHDGQLLRTLPGFGLMIQQLRFGPNEPVLVAEYRSEADERILVWDWQNGQKLFALPHGIHAEAIDFSPDSQQLAVGQTNGFVSIYSLPGGEISRELELRLASGLPRVPQVLRFNPASDLLAESCLDDPYVQIWNLHTTQAVASLFHPDKVYDLSWHPRGEVLATACQDFCVYLWNIPGEDRPMKRLIGHEAGVRAVAFNHRGTLIASLGQDETVRLWVTPTERQLTFRVDGKSFERLQFSQNDRRLMAIDDRRTHPSVWEVSGDEYMVLQAHAGPVDPLKNIDFSLDGRWLAAVSGGQATIWDSHSGRELGVLSFTNAHAAWFSADSHSLVVSTDSGLFKCPLSYSESGNRMRLDSGVFQQLYQAPDELGIMALASDRSSAAVVHHDEVLLLPLELDSKFGWRVLQLQVGSHYQRLALHPHAEWMATAARDPNSVQLWNLARVEGVNASFTVPSTQYFAFSPDGKIPSTQYFAFSPDDKIPSTQYFAFSPDGKWLATCCTGEFQFYRVGDWQKPAFSIRRKPSSSQHAPVAFTRDGRTAAIAASRYTIQLLRMPQNDSTRPETIATLESPDRSPLDILAFSADGGRLAAATMNQLIQLWNLALLHDSLAELKLEGRWPASP
jgi:WD40 repeat protein